MGYRLPTEAEWEFAYRAGTTTAFYNGPITSTSAIDPNLNVIGWYNQNSGGRTHPVARKEPNSWGLFDMAGNVPEAVLGLSRGALAVTDPFAPSTSTNAGTTVRGGSYEFASSYARAASSLAAGSNEPYVVLSGYATYLGFRLVRTVPSQIYTPPTF